MSGSFWMASGWPRKFRRKSAVVSRLSSREGGQYRVWRPSLWGMIRRAKCMCATAPGMPALRDEEPLHALEAETSTEALLDLIRQLNADRAVHGILVQLPLPRQIRSQAVLDAVAVEKDVDAFHPENVGRLSQGRPRFLPCTPHGVLQILHRYGIPVAGRHVVVVGRSEIVGKPLAMMLMQRDSALGADAANATVTVCHSRTRDLGAVMRQAEIVVAAIGQPKFVTADMVRPGRSSLTWESIERRRVWSETWISRTFGRLPVPLHPCPAAWGL